MSRSTRVSSPRNGSARGHRDGHRQVADLQRARILSAMFDVATELGPQSVTVAHVVERSGVSRRTFYEHFADREDCFLAAFDDALKYASARVLPAYLSQARWRDRIRSGLIALLSFLDEEPAIGRLLICESFAGGPKTAERRARVLAQVRSAIEEGSAEAKAGFTPPPLTAEGIVGGVLAVIQRRLAQAGRHESSPVGGAMEGTGSLVELTNPLMSMIVLPYIGSAAARRELERPMPVPTAPRDGVVLPSDPFKDAGMRLTYRTVRVLVAIADRPDASNRTIGGTAGIADQGQISKLLGRLERIGMISNTGLGPGQGAPNAWTLTATGRQVINSIRAHTGTSWYTEGRRP